MKYSTQDFPIPSRTLGAPKRPKKITSTRAKTASVPGAFSTGQVVGDSLPRIIPPFPPPGNSTSPLYFDDSNSFSIRNATTQPIEYHNSFQATWPLEPAVHNIRDDGKTPLDLAVIAQNEQEVKRLLFDGSSVDTRDRNGPLHFGVTGDSKTIVDLLIAYGADVSGKGQPGRSPLHLAVSNATFTRSLLSNGSDVNIQDDNGDTPLHLALLEPYPKTTAEVKESVVYVLIQRNSDLNLANLVGLTPFLRFLDQKKHENDDIFYLLAMHFLRNGASATEAFPDGRTPMQAFLSQVGDDKWCEKVACADVIRHLLEKGADPETLLPSGKPLIVDYIGTFSSYRSNPDLSLGEALLKYASLTPAHSTSVAVGDSLLHVLSPHYTYPRHSRVLEKLFDVLFQRGADLNGQNERGETPLLILLQNYWPLDSSQLIPRLVEKGASPWLHDNSGNMALFIAADRYSPEDWVRTLLKPELEYLERNGFIPIDVGDDSRQDKLRRDWRLAAEASQWTDALALMRGPGSEDSLPERSEKFRKCVCRILAERHLEISKHRFEGDQDWKQKRRKYSARILSDCHGMGIVLDMQHFHDLVDLSL